MQHSAHLSLSNCLRTACAVACISLALFAQNNTAIAQGTTTTPQTPTTGGTGTGTGQGTGTGAGMMTEQQSMRLFMRGLTPAEQQTLTRAIAKLSQEERRVFMKAMMNSARTMPGNTTPGNNPNLPTTPTTPTGTGTGTGTSGTGTTPPRK